MPKQDKNSDNVNRQDNVEGKIISQGPTLDKELQTTNDCRDKEN